ncbi:MAG: homocysteine S-methyltransferase family protein [Butyrivibrio sp.]|nr:homocysteine S-methyltransferase family protein [Butyrivibrio sp.]
MTKQEFLKLFHHHPIYLDGATGTNLMKAGMPAGVCPEAWILEHPDVLVSLQKAYAEAGSDIVYAPTFTANRIKLKEYGLENRLEEINQSLVDLSRQAVGTKALVAGDLTMTGRQLSPIGDLDFEELVDVYKQQIRALESAGADLLVVETMMSLQECRAALIAAKETTDLAVMVSLTFEADGRTLFGSDAASAAIVMESLGAAAVGANCSTGPDQMTDIIRNMAAVTTIPIIAKPNAGLPSVCEDGTTQYDMDPETFAENMIRLMKCGASILGGCCGTTPEFIRLLTGKTQGTVLDQLRDEEGGPIVRRSEGIRYLTSERGYLAFGLDDPFMIVGERINPTGKKKLQAQLRENNLDMVCDFVQQQENDGAAILDVNVGMSGVDEKSLMLKVLDEVTMLTALPLCIDSSDAHTMESALRRYPGRALINSISLEKGKAEKFLPIAQKYGAMFILLPVGKNGLPKNNEEKKQTILELTKLAEEYGLGVQDIVVDGLVATVGADPDAAMNTLDTIRFCHDHGYATICGLSNISFGLPERSYINAAFLTMAIAGGLTMAIANPSQELLVNSAYASDLLRNKDGADLRYIQRMQRYQKENAGQAAGMDSKPQTQVTSDLPEDQKMMKVLYEDVLNGSRRNVIRDTQKAVEAGCIPQEILNQTLMPAINEVGVLFDKGTYFLPQLISSAETMKMSIGYLEPLLKTGGGQEEEMPVIVIATVHGDVHDIGKNLVALMLKNYGFKIVDLGKDVPAEKIITTAIAENAAVIGLSALMTTTMQEMKNVIRLAGEKGCKAKIMIGGAVVTQDFADEIGADAYADDAADAVRVVKKILNIQDGRA